MMLCMLMLISVLFECYLMVNVQSELLMFDHALNSTGRHFCKRVGDGVAEDSAKTEPAWKGAGTKVGLQIWRIVVCILISTSFCS